MFGVEEWPEFKKLSGASVNNSVKLDLKFTDIPKDDLIKRPNQDMWIYNPSGVLHAELNAFHQRLWDNGNKLRLEVSCTEGYVTTEGDGPINLKWF
jgi:hypothetical protein